jgi:hypothetical protein
VTQALDEAVLASFAQFVEGGSVVSDSAHASPSTPFRLYRPLSEAAEEYRDWAEHPELRVYTGILELDQRMRGTAPGEITQILGFSHGGKTVVASQILLNNADKPMILFTPDETRTAVLSKMVALVHGVDAEELESRIYRQDEVARKLLLSTATEHLPYLGVCEDNLTLQDMSRYIEEYESVHGPAAGIMFDYLRLLQGAGEDTASKWGHIKAWGKRIDKPLFVLHQSSRTKGKDGAKVDMSSGEYGGEAESTHIIGVRRKRAELMAEMAEAMEKADRAADPTRYLNRVDELQHDLRLHEHTITINLVKNKRPPMKLVDDLDFELNQRTGAISPLRAGEILRGERTF